MTVANPDISTEGQRTKIVQAAKQAAKAAAGRPYIPGGKSVTGFDCSGFVAYVYQQIFPDYGYMDTISIRTGSRFAQVTIPSPGDLIFFPKGKNPYEVRKGNQREFPNHVGIVLDANTWLGSQSGTGTAVVRMTNPWWGARTKIFLRYVGLGV